MKKIICLVLFANSLLGCKKVEKSYYDTGELLSETYVINDTTFYSIDYFRNGNKKCEGAFLKDSVGVGLWRDYYDDGELKTEFFLENGIPVVQYDNDAFLDLSQRKAYIRFNDDVKKHTNNERRRMKNGKSRVSFRTYVDGVYETFYIVDCVSSSGNAKVEKIETEGRKNSYPYDLVIEDVPDTIIIRYLFCNEEGLIIRGVTPMTEFAVIVEE